MITNNYGSYLEREIEQLTNIRNIAKALCYEEDIINKLNEIIQETVELLLNHTERINGTESIGQQRIY